MGLGNGTCVFGLNSNISIPIYIIISFDFLNNLRKCPPVVLNSDRILLLVILVILVVVVVYKLYYMWMVDAIVMRKPNNLNERVAHWIVIVAVTVADANAALDGGVEY